MNESTTVLFTMPALQRYETDTILTRMQSASQ